jgi:hypothetical protein
MLLNGLHTVSTRPPYDLHVISIQSSPIGDNGSRKQVVHKVLFRRGGAIVVLGLQSMVRRRLHLTGSASVRRDILSLRQLPPPQLLQRELKFIH